MRLDELKQGAVFRFPEDGPEVRRKVLAAGGAVVVVESVGATGRSEGTFLGSLAVVLL